MDNYLYKLFPFLRWFHLTRTDIRADLLAGLSVAMILVPQSMAYAALAGLPVIYGLYASTLPVIVASMWGSSRFLHTGPVAMLSILSIASVTPFAVPGSEKFIELSVMLALMVGILRLLLGLFRLGVIMNFVSHPVIVGFTNAAALIIGLSLLNNFLNVPMPRSDSFLTDLGRVIGQLPAAHWPTLLMGLGTLAFLLGMRRIAPKLPAVLLAVILGTAISAVIGFEKTETASLDQIEAPEARDAYRTLAETQTRLDEVSEELSRLNARMTEGEADQSATDLELEIAQLETEQDQLKASLHDHRLAAHSFGLERRTDNSEPYFVAGDGGNWRVDDIDNDQVVMSGGGDVVGNIPQGLPAFTTPVLDWSVLPNLIPAALVMALIGFMEATSISRALAAQSREKLNANQELVGQGLANIVGSFFQAYTVSGSFSRSAVGAKSGARSGLYAVISAVGVIIVLLWFTPYLYHLPQAVLAAIVMTAVFGLIDFKPLTHAWRVQRADGIAGILTFLVTLYMAPQLAIGVIVGIAAAVFLFLVGTVRPRAEIQGIAPDGTLAGMETHNLPPVSEDFIVLRFDASLVFMNVAYFEEAVIDAMAHYPDARGVLIIGNSINRIDASGVEKIRSMITDLKAANCRLMFSGLKKPVRDAMERAGLVDELGRENLFRNKSIAIRTLQEHGLPSPSEGNADDLDKVHQAS